MKIASIKTEQDWKCLSSRIKNHQNNNLLWEQAFDFFEERIKSRYIYPAEAIANLHQYNGEGFSIVAILCSTIEALESFRTGKIYKKATKNNPINKSSEYYRSQEIFESFLLNQAPFRESFKSKLLAEDFYENVRCSILHEATTRNGWKIRVDTENLIVMSENEKILNRNIFIENIKEYIGLYKAEFMRNDILKANLVQKLDGICKTSQQVCSTHCLHLSPAS